MLHRAFIIHWTAPVWCPSHSIVPVCCRRSRDFRLWPGILAWNKYEKCSENPCVHTHTHTVGIFQHHTQQHSRIHPSQHHTQQHSRIHHCDKKHTTLPSSQRYPSVRPPGSAGRSRRPVLIPGAPRGAWGRHTPKCTPPTVSVAISA